MAQNHKFSNYAGFRPFTRTYAIFHLDGAAAISPLIKRAKALGMKALAITDHGNMYGVKNFHDVATDAGIKPILGCETYVVRNRFEKDKDEKAGDHLILLAKT